jgi:peptide-methionine (S)-S-oxide reductase
MTNPSCILRLAKLKKQEIRPFAFEDYHQKYYLKRFKNAIEKLNTFFPNHTDFVNSTLTARLNGLAIGYGSPSEIRKEINDWGLNTENKKELIELLNQIRW